MYTTEKVIIYLETFVTEIIIIMIINIYFPSEKTKQCKLRNKCNFFSTYLNIYLTSF